MSSGTSSPLDEDAFNCQVCFEPFKGRILQCKMGHAVCEKCHDKLPVCPQCRSAFTGTRNYMMEDLLQKLQKLVTGKVAEAKESGAIRKKAKISTEDEGAVGGVTETDPIKLEQIRRKKEKQKDRKKKKKEALAEARASTAAEEAGASSTSEAAAVPAANVATTSTVVAGTSKKANKKKAAVERKKSLVGGMTSVVVAEALDPAIKESANEQLESLKKIHNIKSPLQPKGLFPCHMLNCFEQFIPTCRILNHIRYCHKDFFTQTTSSILDLSATFNLEIALKNYRHAIHIKDFGLFILSVDVDRENKDGTKDGGQIVHSWVTIFGTRKMAKSFLYDVEVTAGNVKASFSDLCYHALVDEIVIAAKGQCLTIPISNPVSFRKLQIKLTLSRNLGKRSKKRSSETKIKLIEDPNMPDTNRAQASGQTKSGGGAKKKNKKRHH